MAVVVLTLAAGCSSASSPAAAPPTTGASAPPSASAPVTSPPVTSPPVTSAPGSATSTNATNSTGPAVDKTSAPSIKPANTDAVTAAAARPVSASCPSGAIDVLTCWTVAVPLDPSQPAGPTLDLAVTVRRADPAHWTSPVLFESGSNPVNPWDQVSSAPDFPGHDVIWVDARGAGRSDGALDCPAIASYAAEFNTFVLQPDAVTAVRACMATFAGGRVPVASIYNHSVTASDLVAVRRSLGIDHWSVATRTGSADIAIRLAAIDGPAITAIIARSPEVPGTGDSANTLAEMFDRFSADCAATPSCAAVGDLHTLAAAALARVKTPVKTSTTEPGTGVPIVLDDINIQGGIRAAMHDTALAPALAGLIAGVAHASAAADNEIAGYFNTYVTSTATIDLAIYSQNGDYGFPGIEHTADAHGGVFVGFALRQWCAQIGPTPQYSPVPAVTSDVRVLVVLPSYALGSSESNAKSIFAGFSNTTIVSVPGIVDPITQIPDCFWKTTSAFIAATGPTVDTSCLTSPTQTTLK